MKIENNKIVEATESELYEYWLKRFDDIMPFSVYKSKCENAGTKIIEEDVERSKEIDTIIKNLKEYWKQYPDLRLCQLVLNIAYQKPGLTSDPFYLEDNEFLKLLKNY